MGEYDAVILLCVIFIGAVFAYIFILNESSRSKQEEYQKEVQKRKERAIEVADGAGAMTPEEFFGLRKIGNRINDDLNFPGVYVLLNTTKNMYYIGQGTRVGDRVNSHFTGKGNGDVYADYKYDNEFVIKLIKFEGSGYTTLNELEKAMIIAYGANATGYNKTTGNR